MPRCLWFSQQARLHHKCPFDLFSFNMHYFHVSSLEFQCGTGLGLTLLFVFHGFSALHIRQLRTQTRHSINTHWIKFSNINCHPHTDPSSQVTRVSWNSIRLNQNSMDPTGWDSNPVNVPFQILITSRRIPGYTHNFCLTFATTNQRFPRLLSLGSVIC